MSREHSDISDEVSKHGDLPPMPPGWCWTTLQELADIEGGITKDQKRRRTTTMREVPYLRVANVQRGFLDLAEVKTIFAESDEIDALRLKAGDVLFTEGGDRDKLGRGWVWNNEIPDCIHQNHIFRARLNLAAVEPRFVSWHGNYFGQKWFTETGKQTTNLASINKSILRRFPVPVAPLNEQRRIADRIDELFTDLAAGVAALELVRRNLKRYRSAVLHAAVTGRLTAAWRAQHGSPDEPGPKLLDRILAERRRQWEARTLEKYAKEGRQPPNDWRERYPEPTALRTEDLAELPESWCWASVDQLGWVQLGRQRSPRKRSDKYPTRYIRAANLTESGLDLSDVLDMEFEPHELETYRLAAGDLLLSEASGSASQVGKPVVWRDELPDCAFQNTVLRLRPIVVGGDYLHTFFLHCYRNQIFASVARGVGINHLSAQKFSKIAVALPSLAEQMAVVEAVQEKLSQIDALEAEVGRGLVRASRLRQAILKAAFDGKLVPQDPSDEPASVLLARLKSEAAAASATRETSANSRAVAPKHRSRKLKALANGDAPMLFNDLRQEDAPKRTRRRKKQ
jgi:type I restriction enzyme S subunit